MVDLISLFIKSVFIENILLSFFLGMCSFLACSKKMETAFGLGIAVVFVMALTTPLNWLLNEYLLRKGALSWTGNAELAAMDLSFLTFISFIATIAASVQLVEMVVDRFSPKLYASLGIFLPLITVNCAILGGSLLMIERKYTFVESFVFGLGGGVGWFLAIIALAAVTYKIRYHHIPKGMQGTGITFVATGLIAMAFMCFAGIQL
jgi:Na+-transporting NADH:ubiquinone oxidoreductase subunit E